MNRLKNLWKFSACQLVRWLLATDALSGPDGITEEILDLQNSSRDRVIAQCVRADVVRVSKSAPLSGAKTAAAAAAA